jgi:hypothetical protein
MFEMTEEEWLTYATGERLVNQTWVHGRERKLRLFGVACGRRCWPLLEDRDRRSVEVVERFVEGLCSAAVLAAAHERATSDVVRSVTVPRPKTDSCRRDMRDAARAAVEMICHGPTWEAAPISERQAVAVPLRDAEKLAHADLLRCIFGNPFRPVVADPAWQSAPLLGLAQAAYDERHLPVGELDPERLAVLSDALEDAGCTEAAILGHLRAPGPHVRGCWVIDLLLGKE